MIRLFYAFTKMRDRFDLCLIICTCSNTKYWSCQNGGNYTRFLLQSATAGDTQSDIIPRYLIAFFLAHPVLSHAISTSL